MRRGTLPAMWCRRLIAVVWIAAAAASSIVSAGQPIERIESKKTLTRYRGPELEVEVDHWAAQRRLGDELMMLEVAFTGGPGRSSLVRLDGIRVVTPGGHRIPALDRVEFRRIYGRLRMAISQSDAWAGPSARFMGSRRPCGRWFVTPPGALDQGFASIRTSRSEVCFGPLAFHVPSGIQPGPWALTIDLEESTAKIPFTIVP
jgi:hypothetical protein